MQRISSNAVCPKWDIVFFNKKILNTLIRQIMLNYYSKYQLTINNKAMFIWQTIVQRN